MRVANSRVNKHLCCGTAYIFFTDFNKHARARLAGCLTDFGPMPKPLSTRCTGTAGRDTLDVSI